VRLVVAQVRYWNPRRSEATYGNPRSVISWEDRTPRVMAEQRAEYTIWWRSLMLLQSQLAGRLRDHEALLRPSLGIPRAAAAPVIHRGGRDRIGKLPLRQARPLAGDTLGWAAVRRAAPEQDMAA
jgi:hypothetical protein